MKSNGTADDELTKKVISQLDAGLDTLDGKIAQQLARGRAAAVSSYGAGNRRPFSFLLKPAAVSFAVAILLVWSLFALAPSKTPRNLTPEDLEVITSNEQVELIQDLDFYRWLAIKDQGEKEP